MAPGWSVPPEELSSTSRVVVLGHIGHVDALLGEVPEHLDELVWEGVEVDVEFAICDR